MKRLNEENNGKAAELFEMLQRHHAFQAFTSGIVEDMAKLMVELDIDSLWMLTQSLRQ